MTTPLPYQPETAEIAVCPSLDDPDFWDKAGKKTVQNLTNLTQMMEEMANAPKEEIGRRQPGERCMYEIPRHN